MSETKLEKLEKLYNKECALAEKHKQAAKDIKEEMEALKGNIITKAVLSLNLDNQEFDYFMSYLKNKKDIQSAINQFKQNFEKKGEDASHGEKEMVAD